MRKVSCILVAAIVMVGGAAPANCPDVIGIFSYSNGLLLGGRASEAWCGAGGEPVAPGRPGNTLNAESWDGTNLGTQWKLWGMVSLGAVLVSDTVNAFGNGTRTYQTSYDGGQFWLAGDGAWTTGDVELNGTASNFVVVTTITYVNHVPVGQNSNISFDGAFDDCPEFTGCVMQWAISNAALVWNSGMGGDMPGDYPGFLCGAQAGEVFDACCPTMSLDCAIATVEASWSSLKDMYR